MNAHSHERDIRIGKGAWILNACVAPELEDVLNVDSHFQGLDEFFAALEIHCLSECCGIHAFDFDGEAVRNAAMDFDHEMLLVRLSALETSLHDSSEGIIESSRLNHYLTRRAFLELLQHIKKSISPMPNKDLQDNLHRSRSGGA